MEVDHLWVDEISEEGEEALEVGKEGRVVKSPEAGLVEVPLREREGVGYGEPVAVDLEVCASVGWDQEEFDAGGCGEEPP